MKPEILRFITAKKLALARKTPLVELTGEKRVLVENHLGVLAYSTEEICVKVAYGKLVVTGQNLQFLQLNSDQLVIVGEIETISPLRDLQ